MMYGVIIVAGLGADLERRLDDGVGLHLGDLRIGDSTDGSRGGPSWG